MPRTKKHAKRSLRRSSLRTTLRCHPLRTPARVPSVRFHPLAIGERHCLGLGQLGHTPAELSSLRDYVNVLTAIVQQLDYSHTRLLTEMRATRSQVSRHGERLRRLESLAPTDSDQIDGTERMSCRPKAGTASALGPPAPRP
jgi:hypothetical protein